MVLVVAGCAAVGKEVPPAGAGDAARGREVFASREAGHCVLCHAAPGVDAAGDLGPALAGVGSRFTPAQLRQLVADISQVRPDATMPSFHRTEGLNRVASQYAGKPALDTRQLEDVVAFLGSLK